MKKIIVVFGLFIVYFGAFSQDIGDFTLPNVVDNTDFSLAQLSREKAIVIIFMSGKCAFSQHYITRVKAIKDEFSNKPVKFVLINANNSDYVPEESVEAMKKFINTTNLAIPYLADKNKEVKNLLKATRTPEAFILQPKQGRFNIVYQGAIDDNPQAVGDIDHEYLRDALINLLNNTIIKINKTRPVGCLIK